MPTEAPIYDLMLLLSADAEDERRAKIVDDVRQAISSGGGSVAHDDDWGTRSLAYRIAHQGDAEYHLLQFTGPPALLDSLGHSLKITDGVLRFRIIRVLPGTPGPPRPESVPATAPSRPAPASAGPPREPSPAEESPEAEAAEAASTAEAAPAAEAETGTESAEPPEAEAEE